MTDINPMENPITPASIDDAVLADVEVLECPYPTYGLLHEQAKVWQDPHIGLYIITRHDDLHQVLLDKQSFSNWRPTNDHANLTGSARKAYELFKAKDWVPAASLAGRDDPERYLKTFCEEVLRLLGPVQGSTRMTTKDVEIRGVKIPIGALLMVRFGAANRCRQRGQLPPGTSQKATAPPPQLCVARSQRITH